MAFKFFKIRKINLLYFIGFILTSVELIFQIIGKSICQTEGCRIVESFVKGGEIVLLIGGIFLFASLLFFSIKKNKTSDYLHSLILIVALSVEGYLLGFQSFVVKEFCLFCIIIFVIIFLATLFRFIKGRKELVYAFATFITIFLITYFVNPQINEIPSSKYVLIYSKNCPNCKEIIQLCRQLSIPVHEVEAKEILSTLRSLKINTVPVMFCDENSEKKIIIGKENIQTYLLSKYTPIKQDSTGVCPIFSPADCK